VKVGYRQASYLGSARSPEKNPMQKCVGFFFVWWFVVLEAKATSVWAPASAIARQ
jgi:hypothetical protein